MTDSLSFLSLYETLEPTIEGEATTYYLRLPLDPSLSLYEASQGEIVSSFENGLKEGKLFINRKLILQRSLFAKMIRLSLPYWLKANAFKLCKNSGSMLKKLRDDVTVIADDNQELVLLSIFKPAGEHKDFCKQVELDGGLTLFFLPLLCFIPSAVEIILDEGDIFVPESDPDELERLTTAWDEWAAEMSRTFL